MSHKVMQSAILFGLLVYFITGTAFAQTRLVTGTVKDAGNGETLPGVNILVKGTTTGTTTNAEGKYELNVGSLQDTLRFSYIGYETKEIPIRGRTKINIALRSATTGLEEMVVTALGQKREKRTLGYSVQEVKGEEISKTNETDIATSLTGKIAGANISNPNSMGGAPRITLRGVSSVLGNNSPLIVVDGVPLANSEGGFQYDSPTSVINSYDVESISVLKGASASALYGSRGANGVIQITTNNGSDQEGLGVSFNSTVKISKVYGLPDYQNEYGGGSSTTFVEQNGQLFADYSTDESWGPRLDGRLVRQWYSFDDVNGLNGEATPWIAHPNNVKNYYQTGVAFENNLSLSKGGDNYTYRLSFNRRDRTSGIQPESNVKRDAISFNGNADFSNKLSATFSANYIYENAKGRYNSGGGFNRFFQRQVDLGPNSYLSDYMRPDGTGRTWNWRGISGAQNGIINFGNSIYWSRNKNFNQDNTKRLYGRAGITYDFTDYLNINGTVRTDYHTVRSQSRTAMGGAGTSSYQEDYREIQETNAKISLNLANLQYNELSFTGLLAGNVRYNDYSLNANSTNGGLSVPGIYTIENSKTRPSLTDYYQQKRINSLLGQAQIGYKDMMYLELNGRNDWSSALPKGGNSFFYYTITGSFVFTELGALNNSDVFTFGKLRASYSKVGNDTDPYRLNTTYPLSQPFGNHPLISVPNTLNKSDLKPEQTYSWEIGTQLEFFQNRIGLDLTYYNKRSEDQITPVRVSRTSGYSSFVVNAGEITNKGLEVTLNLKPIQIRKGLQWNIQANWTKNVNKVVSLAPGLSNIQFTTTYYGPTVNARVGAPYGALVGTDFKYDENGNKIINPDGTYAIDSTPKILGSYIADWNAGISTSFNYKGFSLSVAFDGQKGGEIFSGTNEFGKYSGMLEITTRDNIRQTGLIAEGVQPDGSKNTVVVDAKSYFKKILNLQAASIYDASYIKLREARLAYSIPVNTFSNTPIKGITVSVTGRNLATLYKNVPNIDPINVTSSGNVQGIEISDQIPPQRVYTFGVQLNF